jgi:AraC-like DNA-binding protein
MAEPVSTPQAQQLKSVQRASVVLDMPISVHQYSGTQENESVCQCGNGAQACSFVSTLPWGPQACRKSRGKAALSAIRRKRSVPFVCHMGFSCVAIELEETDESSLVSTFGPFQPAEATGGLEPDIRAGLSALQYTGPDEMPFTLDDIRAVPMEAVPATADWLRETWQTLAVTNSVLEATLPDIIPTSEPSVSIGRNWKQNRSFPDPFSAKHLLSAVQSNDKKVQRQIIENQFQSATPSAPFSPLKRAQMVALASSFIYAAEESGFDTARLRMLLPALQSDLEKEATVAEAVNILLRFVRKMNSASSGNHLYQDLNRILQDHLEQGITLASVAKKLDCNPTTLTKNLQRSFGMSYSEYLGRMRVEQGKTLLHTTDLTIVEIAKRMGLRDSSNFGKLFRKFEGISPSQYRRHMKNS